MVNAIVLLKAEPSRIKDVAQKLVDIKHVREVYSVGGRFDLVAVIQAPGNEDISEIVTGRITGIQGITSTETLVAFKVFSNYDLERLFSVGLD